MAARRTAIGCAWALLLACVATAAAAEIVRDTFAQLSAVEVRAVATPRSVAEVAALVRDSPGPISIGGARYSMGGQTATDGALLIDMRAMDQVVALDVVRRQITVQAGITWRKVLEHIDPHGLAVQIMQTYANFTVGGALGVNAHGRYVGQGPIVLSVASIRLVLADGQIVSASPTENPQLFFGAVGGYGGVGVIVEATLRLTDNVHLRRESEVMSLASYGEFFERSIRANPATVFHNADIYPPAFDTVRATSYVTTTDALTDEARLASPAKDGRAERAVVGMIATWPGGTWFRRHVAEPWYFRGREVEWRNHEAAYDIGILEPRSRANGTFVLQEYFVPPAALASFAGEMGAILRRHHVQAVNVSIRHARQDPGTLLAWAKTEVFAFVLYYRERPRAAARADTGVWTRELIDAALAAGGSFYLPYEIWATPQQFAAAYPRAGEFFALKRRVDPANKFRNKLWDAYAPR